MGGKNLCQIRIVIIALSQIIHTHWFGTSEITCLYIRWYTIKKPYINFKLIKFLKVELLIILVTIQEYAMAAIFHIWSCTCTLELSHKVTIQWKIQQYREKNYSKRLPKHKFDWLSLFFKTLSRKHLKGKSMIIESYSRD